MHNTKLFKILGLTALSLGLLVGFKEKFVEKNQTGSPKTKKDAKTEVKAEINLKESVEDLDESSLVLDVGPASEDRKKFDGWYNDLEQSMRNKKSPQERLEALQRGLVRIEKDREQLQNLKFSEEIEIDFLIKPLKILPSVSQFKVQNCGEYKMKILSHFDPTTEDEVKDPSLKKAINVFKLICTN